MAVIMAVIIPWAGAFVVLMVSSVVKASQQTLSRLILNRVSSLKNFEMWKIMEGWNPTRNPSR